MIREKSSTRENRKKGAAVFLTAMLLMTGFTGTAFAGSDANRTASKTSLVAAAVTTTTPATTTTGTAVSGATLTLAGMTFSGETTKLSLDQAVEQMQTVGSDAETALLNKKSDEAVAKGFKEDIANYKESDMTGQAADKVAKLRRDFAKTQVEANYKAELNGIAKDTVELYYGVLQAEENLRVAKESYTNEKTIYTNTMKKYNLGTAAKIDTLTANTAMIAAEADVKEAETTLASARMNFNLLLGFDLMRNVTFTDTLKQLDAPTVALDEAITSAVANRNEIKGAALNVQIQKILLDSYSLRYSHASSKYLTQQVTYLTAVKASDEAPAQIEMDIRAKYMGLADKARAVTTAQATLSNAKEAYRLAVITYDAGMNTLTDVHESQIKAAQAGQAVNAAIVDYDLAVKEFESAIDVGTTRLDL